MRLSKKLETQLNSYKEFNENQILLHELNKALRQRDQYKAERDTLIDDLPWYKAKVGRLEQRISKLVDENTRLQNELYTMGLNQDEADDKIREYKTLLSEISQHIGNKPSSSTYKYFRAKLDGLEIREDD